MENTVRNRRLSDEEFFLAREEVLAEWPTGEEVDLDEAVAYHKSMPPSKNYAKKYAEARRTGNILITSMSGVATVEGQIELHRYLQDEGQVDLLRLEEDTLTKSHNYVAAEQAVEEAKKTGKNTLNGFPVVTHGVAGCRRLIEAVRQPITLDGTVIDQRLICEIGFAGGLSGVTSGPLSAFGQYSKNIPLATIIRNFQYVYRLMGYYEEKGVPMLYRGAGQVEGPQSLQIADEIIENLLAAEQGVKNVIAQPHQYTGNLAQDVAATQVMRKLTEEYLNRQGYKDVTVYTQCHHPYGRFPLDHPQAYAILATAPICAALSGADSFMTFTVDEAWTTPTKENNAASLRFVRMLLNFWKVQAHQFDMLNNKAVKEEAEEMEKEARAILDRVLDLGDGDCAIGATRAFETGELDVEATLYTSKFVKGEVFQVRDATGARRYLDTGKLPFTEEMKEFHRRKIADRSASQGKEVDYDTMIGDWTAFSRGEYLSGPDWQEKQLALANRGR